MQTVTLLKMGSPPPMRGKVNNNMEIPSSIWDHPRLCGEKLEKLESNTSPAGSPPPMRGKD